MCCVSLSLRRFALFLFPGNSGLRQGWSLHNSRGVTVYGVTEKITPFFEHGGGQTHTEVDETIQAFFSSSYLILLHTNSGLGTQNQNHHFQAYSRPCALHSLFPRPHESDWVRCTLSPALRHAARGAAFRRQLFPSNPSPSSSEDRWPVPMLPPQPRRANGSN